MSYGGLVCKNRKATGNKIGYFHRVFVSTVADFEKKMGAGVVGHNNMIKRHSRLCMLHFFIGNMDQIKLMSTVLWHHPALL